MNPEIRAEGAFNRRAFLKRSLPAAGVVAASASGMDLLPSVVSAAGCEVNTEKCIDLRFVQDMMNGPRRFGDLTPGTGRPTLVIHFFGLCAFVKKHRFLLADPMRVLLPDSKEVRHRARLWALKADVKEAVKEDGKPDDVRAAGDYRYWELNPKNEKGTRIRVVKEGGCRLRRGRLRCHPWEDCDFISNLKELFPQGDLWPDDVMRTGAGGNIVTYFSLPGGGRLISGVPWSCKGNDTIWKYQTFDGKGNRTAVLPVRERTLTDNVSFFRPLEEDEGTEVTIYLDAMDKADGEKRTQITLRKNHQNIIPCVITHAMPSKACDSGHTMPAAAVARHSELYYKLFKNHTKESPKPVPVFTRSVRGLSFGDDPKALDEHTARLKTAAEAAPSIDDTHCECASWI